MLFLLFFTLSVTLRASLLKQLKFGLNICRAFKYFSSTKKEIPSDKVSLAISAAILELWLYKS